MESESGFQVASENWPSISNFPQWQVSIHLLFLGGGKGHFLSISIGNFSIHILYDFFTPFYSFLLGRWGDQSSICAHNHHPITCRIYLLLGFPGGTSGKEPTCQSRRHKRCGFNPWVRKILWRKKWQHTPVLLPGKSHGQMSLAGDSLWGCSVGHDWSYFAHIYPLLIDFLKSSYFPRTCLFLGNLQLWGITFQRP